MTAHYHSTYSTAPQMRAVALTYHAKVAGSLAMVESLPPGPQMPCCVTGPAYTCARVGLLNKCASFLLRAACCAVAACDDKSG
jgi:hypothetical protein